MKTSNKLIIIATVIIVIGIISFSFKSYNDVINHTIKGNGKMIHKTFNVAGFSRAELQQFNFELIKSNEHKIVATIDENLGSMLDIEVKDSQLSIKIKNGNYLLQNKVKIQVFYTQLSELHALSGANIVADFLEPYLKLDFESGSIADFSFDGDVLNLESGSGSNITFKGKAGKVMIIGESGSIIDARELVANDCSIELGSGAQADIFASQNLEATASSGASITYFGNPKNIKTIEIESGASIKKGN